MVRLLDLTPADATINASFYVIQPNYPVVDALISAHARGAGVRVVLDSGDGQSASTNQAVDAAFARLAAALGNDPAAPSFAMQCVLACISKSADSINHNKFVTMSQAGDLQDVVFQSTANLRSDGSGDAAWNAAVVTSGNPDVMAQYESYFNDLAARRAVPGNDYHAVRPPVTYGASTPYYFPRTDGRDSLSQALMGVDCAATPTNVDVMAAFFTRRKVRNRLNELAAAGCAVRVIARTDTITREFCDTLQAPVQVRIADKSSRTKVGIHGKYLTISGGFEGQTDRRVVWMGSHNLTRNALVRNDETFLLTDDAPLHAAFTKNFDAIWSHPSLTAGCGRAGGTSEQAIEEEANTEVTPLIKEKQRIKRKLPKRLKRKRTALKSTRTVQGTPVEDHREMQGGRQWEEAEEAQDLRHSQTQDQSHPRTVQAEAHAEGPDHPEGQGVGHVAPVRTVQEIHSQGEEVTPPSSRPSRRPWQTVAMGHTVRSAAALVVGALLLGSATSTGAALDGPPPVDPPPVEITASPAPAPEPSPTMRTGQEALFNYPVPGTPDLSISDALVDLVDGTPAGESIVLSYFVVQPGHPVIDALLRAYSRGVSVKVVLDSGDGQKAKKNGAVDAAYATLAETLGTAGDSFARQCNRSCITDEPDSINHNKFAAFSRTGDAVNVVFQGTGNLRVDGSGDSAYNAGVIIRGDQTTYQQYLGYFDDLYTERRVDKRQLPPLAPAPHLRTGDRVLLPPHGQDRHRVRGVAFYRRTYHSDCFTNSFNEKQAADWQFAQLLRTEK